LNVVPFGGAAEAFMRRRTKLFLTLGAAVLVAGGALAWYVWSASALDRRLVGRWDGQVRINVSFSIGPGQAVPPMSVSETVQSVVKAEFRPDGTYTWSQESQGGTISNRFSVPNESAPGRWEVVARQGNKLRLRIHCGLVDFDFNGLDSFLMTSELGFTGPFQRSAQ
jgi:hypothetical protein